jgi:hypothetical protein
VIAFVTPRLNFRVNYLVPALQICGIRESPAQVVCYLSICVISFRLNNIISQVCWASKIYEDFLFFCLDSTEHDVLECKELTSSSAVSFAVKH